MTNPSRLARTRSVDFLQFPRFPGLGARLEFVVTQQWPLAWEVGAGTGKQCGCLWSRDQE